MGYQQAGDSQEGQYPGKHGVLAKNQGGGEGGQMAGLAESRIQVEGMGSGC